MAIDSRFVTMPFDEAIAFLRQKVNIDTDTSYDIRDAQHDAAFVVAGAKGTVLTEMRNAVERALVEGQRLSDFRKEFDRIAQSWTHTGNDAWRAKIIYDTNVRMAHAAGRYERQLDPEVVRLRPYLRYIHGGSRDPRPAHIALDGKVFRAGELPFYPPNGYGCSCRTISLNDRDISRLGLEVASIARGDRLPVTVNGQRVEAIIEPEKGFDSIPGQSPQQQRDQMRAELLANMKPPFSEEAAREMRQADRANPPDRERSPEPETPRQVTPTPAPAPQPTPAPAPVPAPPPATPDIGSGEQWRPLQENARQRFADSFNRLDSAVRTNNEIIAEANAAINRIAQEMQAAIDARDSATYQRLRAEVDQIQQQAKDSIGSREDPVQVMQDLRQQIINSARVVSPEAAAMLASKFAIPAAVAREYGSEAAFRAVLAETIQISDGLGLGTLRTIELTDSRANARPWAGTINVGSKPTMDERRTSFFHEFAHHWEYGDHRGENRVLMAAARDYIFNKATSPVVEKLSVITGRTEYGDSEVALPGVSPVSPYVGKSYSQDPNDRTAVAPTEVFAMGFQHFRSPEAMLKLYQTDRDLFEFTLGVLRR